MKPENVRIESLLSARLFLVPQIVGDRIYFISNLSGRNSLYVMDHGGSVPEPLLPPHIALQNPHLMPGLSFVVFPGVDKILVMIDEDGDENYQPMFIPPQGGYPEPAFGDVFEGYRVIAGGEDLEANVVYFLAESRAEPLNTSYRADVATGELVKLGESMYVGYPAAQTEDHDAFILLESYGAGDNALFYKELADEERRLVFGNPKPDREPGQEVGPTAVNNVHFTPSEKGLLFTSILFDDAYGPGLMPLNDPEAAEPVTVDGLVHEGEGELETIEHVRDDVYTLEYNIDGSSWLYEAELDEAGRALRVCHVLVGQEPLSGGVLESARYDDRDDRYALSFSTAVSPTQSYTVEGEERDRLVRHTNERILGIPTDLLSTGEDSSYTSFDGLRISARLYRPAPALGYEGPRPLVYYIHGGPQSQERPDFAWFSMPLIQFLTLKGFAVFVPNVRGSTGYGFDYMRHVVRDWGGQDRLDHVHAMTEILPQDDDIDVGRAGVVGRSYGGYMTLTLAGRHPELWSAAVDMFGPYNLLTFADRVPETWKPFMAALVGDPEEDLEFMLERSPRTYLHNLQCPLLVIQGKNDPRVREVESRELVEELRDQGKTVDYLMLEDEGHDILKFDNRVRVYNAIADFFAEHL